MVLEMGRPIGMVVGSLLHVGHRIEGGKGGAFGGPIDVEEPFGRCAFHHVAHPLGIDGLTPKEHLVETLEYLAVLSGPVR